MLELIDLIEEVGRSAHLRNASDEVLKQDFNRRKVDPAISSVVLSRDSSQLEQMLGANVNVCCVQRPADEEDGQEQPDEAAADDDGTQAMAANL